MSPKIKKFVSTFGTNHFILSKVFPIKSAQLKTLMVYPSQDSVWLKACSSTAFLFDNLCAMDCRASIWVKVGSPNFQHSIWLHTICTNSFSKRLLYSSTVTLFITAKYKFDDIDKLPTFCFMAKTSNLCVRSQQMTLVTAESLRVADFCVLLTEMFIFLASFLVLCISPTFAKPTLKFTDPSSSLFAPRMKMNPVGSWNI